MPDSDKLSFKERMEVYGGGKFNKTTGKLDDIAENQESKSKFNQVKISSEPSEKSFQEKVDFYNNREIQESKSEQVQKTPVWNATGKSRGPGESLSARHHVPMASPISV